MKQENKRFLLLHFILWLVTFGVWQRIWLFKTTNILNAEEGCEKRPAWLCLLLSFVVPCYYFFWTYETVKGVEKIAKRNEVEANLANRCLIFSLIFPFVSGVLIQDTLNEIIDVVDPAPEEPVAPPEPAPAASVAATGYVQEDPVVILGRFKNLLDQGIITQEEFDAKKKQLLGI